MSKSDPELLTAPRNLNDFLHQYNSRKETFEMNERHDTTIELTTKQNFFSNNYIVDVFLFITSIISVLVTTLAIYLMCKH